MKGNHDPAGAIVMDDQIVDAEYEGIFSHNVFDFFNKCRIRCLSHEGADSVFCRFDATMQDEDTNKNTAPAINVQTGKVRYDRSNEDSRCSKTVTEAVGGSCPERCRVYFFAQCFVVTVHIEFDENGTDENDKHKRSTGDILRMEDFGDRRTNQFHCHYENDNGDNEAGNIFTSSMSERMVGVCFLRSNPKADQCDDRRACIGQIVEGICDDGDGSADQACTKFCTKEQNIQKDAEHTAYEAVFLPYFRRFNIFSVFYQQSG